MNDPLAELKDIHIPNGINAWPPAYGWWIVALLLLSSIVLLTIFLLKRHKQQRAKHQALAILKTMNAQQPDWALKLNSLLKRVAQSYFSELPIQSLHGKQWAHFLGQCLAQKHQAEFTDAMLSFQAQLYQSEPHYDFDQAYGLVSMWLNKATLSNRKKQHSLRLWCQSQLGPSAGESHV